MLTRLCFRAMVAGLCEARYNCLFRFVYYCIDRCRLHFRKALKLDSAYIGQHLESPYDITLTEADRNIYHTTFFEYNRIYTSAPFAQSVTLCNLFSLLFLSSFFLQKVFISVPTFPIFNVHTFIQPSVKDEMSREDQDDFFCR